MSKVKKFMSLFLVTVVVSSMFSVVFANDMNNRNTLINEELVRLLREAKGGEVGDSGQSAIAIGVIGGKDDGKEKIAAMAMGEIGKESERTDGLATVQVLSDRFLDDYLGLSFEVSSTVSSKLVGTATITAYHSSNGRILSKTQVTSTDNLNQKFFMWVGNSDKVKIKMSGAFVTVDGGQTYPLSIYESFDVCR